MDRTRVARLATVDSKAKPFLVPVVFAFDGKYYYIPIDEKTKTSTAPDKLKRIKNIEINPFVALLIDEYDEDWSKLVFVMVQGRASILVSRRQEQQEENNNNKILETAHKLLSSKYPQYQKIGIGKACIMIYPQKAISWKMIQQQPID